MDYDEILTDEEPLESNDTTFPPEFPPWVDGNPYFEKKTPDNLERSDLEIIIEEAFRLLAEQTENYVERKEQVGMANQLMLALYESQSIVLEAGTGVGKSFAYIIATIACSYLKGARVLLSTETQSLQLQLVEKDLPWVSKVLDPSLEFSLCLGSGNYLCRLRCEETSNQGKFTDIISEKNWTSFQNWSHSVFQTKKYEGTKFETNLKLSSDFWSLVNRNPDSCPGQRCGYFQDCNYYRVRKSWYHKRVLVANHHLYLFHLLNEKRTLPPLDVVVIDEAHGLGKIGSRIFELVFHNESIKDIYKSYERLKNASKTMGPEASSEIEEEWQKITNLWGLFFQQYEVHCSLSFEDGTEIIQEPGVSPGDLSNLCKNFILEWTKWKENEEDSNSIAYLNMLERWFQRARNFFIRFEQFDQDSNVFWAEKARERFYLHCCRIDLGADLQDSKSEVHVYTSATLGFWGAKSAPVKRSQLLNSGYFSNFIRENSPFHETELSRGIYFSPFNYKTNCLLYTPANLEPPSYNSAMSEKIQYQESLCNEILRLINLSQGGALVLFTSYSQLKQAHEFLLDKCDYPIYSQQLDGAVEALEQFRSSDEAVLLGTNSFWQGVDIAGRSLRTLIITKLMFTPPDDPIFKARSTVLENQNKNSFYELALPFSSIMLRQAFGRLIRNELDKGVAAILDSRVLSKNYGKILLQNLPKVDHVTTFPELETKTMNMNLFSAENN